VIAESGGVGVGAFAVAGAVLQAPAETGTAFASVSEGGICSSVRSFSAVAVAGAVHLHHLPLHRPLAAGQAAAVEAGAT